MRPTTNEVTMPPTAKVKPMGLEYIKWAQQCADDSREWAAPEVYIWVWADRCTIVGHAI
jgi:hypothetical protein